MCDLPCPFINKSAAMTKRNETALIAYTHPTLTCAIMRPQSAGPTTDAVCIAIVFDFGSALGFRFRGGLVGAVGALLILVLFAFAVSWLATLMGLAVRSAEAVQGLSVVLIFPLTFGSNVFVPTANLPGWLQAWVRINPVSALSDAERGLILGGATSHAVLVALAWCAALVAVFAPAGVLVYRRAS